MINELVDESSKEFDFSIFYGGETSVFEILEKVKRYPMISEYNVVLIKEGQNIHRQGTDQKFGSTLIKKNTVITAAEIGILATVGKIKIKVAIKIGMIFYF